MALIRTGGGITQISGSYGGAVFQQTRSGPSVRSRIAGLQPRTSTQSGVKSLHQYLTRYWSHSLSNVERAAWRTFASSHPTTNRLGNTQLLSGFNWFVRCNSNMIAAGGSVFNTPPASLAVTAPTSSAPSSGAGNVYGRCNSPALAGPEYVQFQFTQPLPAGVSYVNNKFYTIGYSNTVNSNVDWTTEYTNKWGQVPTGSGLVFAGKCTIINQNTGAASVPVIGYGNF